MTMSTPLKLKKLRTFHLELIAEASDEIKEIDEFVKGDSINFHERKSIQRDGAGGGQGSFR